MARFLFKLEAVLKQRRNEERDEQLAVAEIERQRIGLENRIRGMQSRIAAERLELRRVLVSPGNGFDDIRRQAGAATVLNAQTQRLVLELAGVHTRLDKARSKLQLATRRRKAMGRLRERRYEAWDMDERRKEAGAADDLNITAAARKETVL